jgi:hypothetical protein
VVVSGLSVSAPEVKGLTVTALNGFRPKNWWFAGVNNSYTGLSIGLVNFSRSLKGVQLGVINYAGNNPRWLRLLPIANAHF